MAGVPPAARRLRLNHWSAASGQLRAAGRGPLRPPPQPQCQPQLQPSLQPRYPGRPLPAAPGRDWILSNLLGGSGRAAAEGWWLASGSSASGSWDRGSWRSCGCLASLSGEERPGRRAAEGGLGTWAQLCVAAPGAGRGAGQDRTASSPHARSRHPRPRPPAPSSAGLRGADGSSGQAAHDRSRLYRSRKRGHIEPILAGGWAVGAQEQPARGSRAGGDRLYREQGQWLHSFPGAPNLGSFQKLLSIVLPNGVFVP